MLCVLPAGEPLLVLILVLCLSKLCFILNLTQSDECLIGSNCCQTLSEQSAQYGPIWRSWLVSKCKRSPP